MYFTNIWIMFQLNSTSKVEYLTILTGGDRQLQYPQNENRIEDKI